MKIPENDPITLSNDLIHSLLNHHIPLIQSFKGKWGLIKSKLADLQTELTDFSEFQTSLANPLSLDLLHSISQTLTDAILSAEKCQDTNLTEGKLKTQSDIDSILAKLNQNVKDCEILIKSGVLQDGIVSGSGSKRELVRAESRNLITRLQIGSPESKNLAMDSVLSLIQEDDKNVMIAVAQGIVPVLVRLLDCNSCLDIKEKTVAAISIISMVDSSKHVLIAEGLLLLNQLIRILESGSGFAKEKACIALQTLSFSRENARAIGSRGGICSLLEICQAGTPSSQGLASGVLRNLAVFEEIRENFIEENAVFVLIGLAASGTALAQENAIGCLCNLVKDDENLKLLIVKEGVIECLRNYWDSCPPIRSPEVAVELLRELASSQAIAEGLVSDGFIVRLVAVLNLGVSGVRIAAARAASELSCNTKTRKEMGELGCIGPLIKMLDGKAVEEKEAAAKALSLLVLYAGNRRIFRKSEGGIVSTVQLLDTSIQNLDKKYPVSILASLVHSKKCRKQMIAAGASVHLKKLVDMNVEGSKKLLNGLGRGKIWGVFARP
ncbi:hypothetical protein D5086_023614 [Populus alba]|uniref:Armadillo/beta-catenin repeat family protein n=3 Tax=Populus TaxID=3689 RepID=A0A4U5MHP5_POPAL|nr:uncharacterized protein LOC118044631 [Populus alba]KAJ6977831.1 hypothetical protein NC653_029663 [Populus alba x Populus x berolinensis]TKR68791.1 armadillo/beta-catenin repeat family protein [Populus alba]